MSKNKTLDPELIRTLAEIMQDTGLTLLEFEVDDEALRLERKVEQVMVAAAPVAQAAAPVASPATGLPQDAGAPAAADTASGTPIRSPMVGTAYLQAEPGAAPFAKVGDTIKEGQTLLIVEAMKVMNPIPAPFSGVITSINITDGQPVEYDELLMTVERAG